MPTHQTIEKQCFVNLNLRHTFSLSDVILSEKIKNDVISFWKLQCNATGRMMAWSKTIFL